MCCCTLIPCWFIYTLYICTSVSFGVARAIGGAFLIWYTQSSCCVGSCYGPGQSPTFKFAWHISYVSFVSVFYTVAFCISCSPTICRGRWGREWGEGGEVRENDNLFRFRQPSFSQHIDRYSSFVIKICWSLGAARSGSHMLWNLLLKIWTILTA